eukprot:TCONS_00018750-protein
MMVARQKHHIEPSSKNVKAKNTAPTVVHRSKCLKLTNKIKVNLNINIMDKFKVAEGGDDKLQVRLTLELNVRNLQILYRYKTLNLNIRLFVNDLREDQESLATVKVTKKVDYRIW